MILSIMDPFTLRQKSQVKKEEKNSSSPPLGKAGINRLHPIYIPFPFLIFKLFPMRRPSHWKQFDFYY